jgi:hypothetical protein
MVSGSRISKRQVDWRNRWKQHPRTPGASQSGFVGQYHDLGDFGWLIDGFWIGWLDLLTTCTHLLGTTGSYSAIANIHTLQFTVTHALRFSAYTSRILATNFISLAVTSNHSWIGQLHARPLYLQEESPWYPLARRLDARKSRSGLLGEEKISCPPPGMKPRTSSPFLVAISTWKKKNYIWPFWRFLPDSSLQHRQTYTAY